MGHFWEKVLDIAYRASIVVIVLFGVFIVFAFADTFMMDHGIYIGSRQAKQTWVEPGKKVHGEILVCRYFGLKDVYHERTWEEPYWPPGTGKTVSISDGSKTGGYLISPSHIGVSSCPWLQG